MSYQHVLFNFGKDNFKYPPPEIEFKNFNKFGSLPDEKKYVLPRYFKIKYNLPPTDTQNEDKKKGFENEDKKFAKFLKILRFLSPISRIFVEKFSCFYP